MKKLIALLLVLVMVVGLVACTGKPKGSVYWLNFKPESKEALEEIAQMYTEKTGVEVKVVTGEGNTATVVGALTGLERVDKITKINGRGLDLRAQGLNLFLEYTDAPGALGTVGTKLGANGINIEAAALTQEAEGDGAILILRVEREVPEALVEEINADLNATAFQVDLG